MHKKKQSGLLHKQTVGIVKYMNAFCETEAIVSQFDKHFDETVIAFDILLKVKKKLLNCHYWHFHV